MRKGLLAALIIRLVFDIALGPCTLAYMVPMLAVTFNQPLEAKWMLLDQTWEQVGIPLKYEEYVQAEINKFLNDRR